MVRHDLPGTRYGIQVEPADGLLTQGAHGYAFTWIDRLVNGEPVTARRGKAVELKALWMNGLAVVTTLYERTRRDSTELRGRHTTAPDRPFPAAHRSPVRHRGPEDVRLRPNQLLAFGLPYAPMTPHPQAQWDIGAALLAPLGLPTLAAGEPCYRSAHRDRHASGTRRTPGHGVAVADRARTPTPAGGPQLPARWTGRASRRLRSGVNQRDRRGPSTAHRDGLPVQAWSAAEAMRVRKQPLPAAT